MTNGEKYKTADEREKAFIEFCNTRSYCGFICPCYGTGESRWKTRCSQFRWLDLEAEEKEAEAKPEPCPFCGSMYVSVSQKNFVRCDICGAEVHALTVSKAIAAWNRRAK